MVGAVGSMNELRRDMNRRALKELERLNGEGFGGIKVFIDIEKFKEMIPRVPCDCMKCYLLTL